MSDKHTRVLKELKLVPTGNKANILEVDLCYDIGGMNYFSGESEPRGLYLGCSPIEKSEGWRSFVAFTGTKVFVKELKRFSKKALEEYVVSEEDIQSMIDHVIKKNNLTLAKD
jgi:hypothetical protein